MSRDPFAIPEQFAARMRGVFGADPATGWLARLPQIVEQLAAEWRLIVEPPIANLSYTWVAPATREDGTRAMLKIGFPDPELQVSIDMLRLCNGRGMVRLLESRREQAASLLELIEPGATLRTVEDDDDAMAIAADVMRQIWRPVPAAHTYPHVADWARGLARLRERFDGGTGPLPARLVERAETHFAELLPSMAEPVVLHADLHHENILSATRAPWLAIDPHGAIGEPAYETGALLRNPIPEIASEPNLARLLSRRIDVLAERLELDRQRIRAWAIAQAVLSAWWDIEGETGEDFPAIACAEALAARA